ncbi:MAG: ribonuclease R [Nitrospinae bacterium CG11_big_fil_rev_8_21_14_0_20_56_8]|nr:MAG: ribonuclease R [Nitrospinae bacterium CG11_big_fil_rev_8_21_14_0_20_56_8]
MELTEEAILEALHERANRPMKISELVRCLNIPDAKRGEFRNCIKRMTTQGNLVRIRGGRYGLPDQMSLVSGTLTGHPNGYGFLVPDLDTGDGQDIYISRKNMKDAMHLDRVMIRVQQGRYQRSEGQVIRILERGTTSLVGTYEMLGREGWVVPLEEKFFHDVFVPSDQAGGAKPGQVVEVEITRYPTRNQPLLGRVVDILGYSQDPEVEIRSILRKHGVHQDFPPRVLDFAGKQSAVITQEERERRKILTDWTIYTIDGERAKDFDDAVSIEGVPGGYRLGIHIADVSHYVEQGSPLDREAYDRGTSIYYPDGVIPMLPFQLSNEICSLKPHEERLTLSVLIDFDEEGNEMGNKIFESIIQSKRRFTYTEVADLLDDGDETGPCGPFLESLKTMHKLSRILRKRRFSLGSVDFKVPEADIHMNSEGKVEDISVADHNEAHELIEEFMLAANQVVARRLAEKKVPSIHRIHESPDEDKLAAFSEFIGSFGLRLKNIHNVRSTELQQLLTKIRGRPEERVINNLLLRSMKKALYSERDPGHFCLGFEHYTHFTSPIRRYPDLVIHRLVKNHLNHRLTGKEKKELFSYVADCAEQSSTMERKAMDIEREICDLRRAQYMSERIGKTYSGHIVSVTPFGFFVQLDEVFVEGLVRLSGLSDDYYIYIQPEHKLVGQRRHRTFRIGDSVKIRIADVDIARRQIEFSLLKQL